MRYNRRRPDSTSGRKKPKPPLDDDDDEYEDRKRQTPSDISSRDNRKPTRVGVRRPPSEIYEDDLQQADDDRLEKRRKNNRDKSQTPSVPSDEPRAVIKPVSGTLYDRPRLAPKINLPVPKNAAHKFAYKPIGSQIPTIAPAKDVEYDEDEEKPVAIEIKTTSTTSKPLENVQAEDSSRSYKRTKLDSNTAEAPRLNIRKRPVSTTEIPKEVRTEEPTSTAASQDDATSAKARTIMRKFRRPFLPSRGGSPYTARNLKPVGEKAPDSDAPTDEVENTSELVSAPGADDYEDEEIQERRQDKTKPVRVKSPLLVDISAELRKSTAMVGNSNSRPLNIKMPIKLIKPSTERFNNNAAQERTTESIEKLYENYDETLNEASPVLTFPFQKFPTALGNSNNYIYNNRYYRSTK